MKKIYKLVHPKLGVVYIGRTKLTLKKRKSLGYKGCGVEMIAKECDIELIEETDDSSRERYWIDYYGDCLMNIRKGDSGLEIKDYQKDYHKINAFKSQKEYHSKNKEKIKEYRAKNTDKINEYERKRYEENKEKINKRRRELSRLKKEAQA
jgi:hypothetical protein